jgi:hypothetical protein
MQQRREQVQVQRSAFDEKMSALGIKVVRKGEAHEPVNVQIRREVQILREPPLRAPGPAEPHIATESLAEILNRSSNCPSADALIDPGQFCAWSFITVAFDRFGTNGIVMRAYSNSTRVGWSKIGS